jgi:hypothetical protein
MTMTANIPNQSDDVKEFKRYLELAEDKTVITLLEKLVDNRLLEYITEYPSVQYTKEMVKLMTYAKTFQSTYNLNLDVDDEGNPVENEDVELIREMCRQFMLKMTSHKRRRSHEIVNGASRQDSGTQVNLSEHKGMKRFLGIKS